MSERWVIKDGKEYCTADSWSWWKADALVFSSRDDAEKYAEHSLLGPTVRFFRLFKPSERDAELRRAIETEAGIRAELVKSAREEERRRIADWLDVWRSFNRPLLKTRAGSALDLTRGRQATLDEIIPRIRVGDLKTSWAVPE